MTKKSKKIKKAKKRSADQMLEELVSIKKLLILLLYTADVPDSEISKAANIGSSTIRGIFSKKKLKKSKIGKGD